MTQPAVEPARMSSVHLPQVMQHFLGSSAPQLEDVVREFGIRERLAAKARQRADALREFRGREMGRPLAQVAQARGDHLQARIRALDLADAGNHARHAFERVLVRDIAALVERPVHVRVEVGVADGHVQQLHAELPMQAAGQRERLGQIRLRAPAPKRPSHRGTGSRRRHSGAR